MILSSLTGLRKCVFQVKRFTIITLVGCHFLLLFSRRTQGTSFLRLLCSSYESSRLPLVNWTISCTSNFVEGRSHVKYSYQKKKEKKVEET